MRRHRSRYISVTAVRINVNRSSSLIMTRLISVNFLKIKIIRTRTCTSTLSSIRRQLNIRRPIPLRLLRIRSLAP